MKTSINLLGLSQRRQQMLRRRVAQWCKLIVVVLLGGMGIHWYLSREQAALARRYEALANGHRPTEAMLRELISMREQLAEIKQQELVARELEQQRQVLAVLGLISQSARRTDGRLRVTKLELSDFQRFEHVRGAAPDDAGGACARLNGVALDNPSVAELLEGLQDSGFFQRVELLALKERDGEVSELRDYELRGDL